MGKRQCPECIGGTLRSTVQRIISGPYRDLNYDSLDRVLDKVYDRVTGYIEIALPYTLMAKARQGETHGAAKCREGRRRRLFKGGMTPEKALCAECIGGDLRKAVRGICVGSYQGPDYSSIDHMLDEAYGQMARHLELAELHEFVTDAWKAQNVTCNSALCRGWKRKTWEKYVGKSRSKGLGWLARADLVVKGQRGWEWAHGVTLEDVLALAADKSLQAFAEMRQKEEQAP